ncbi:MAG: hypothetical protein M1834_001028 [Cirrosporium novae-zelandiae]|nr:MAG: hypothetical protein M1834_001028 [Cirrosporium novae-zelandiae]
MSQLLEGVFAIHKPPGNTSAEMIRKLQTHFTRSNLFAPNLDEIREKMARDNHNQRKRRRQKAPRLKIGHGGTLDPDATGVLAIGIGNGCKTLNHFLSSTKCYEAVVLFGAASDTYDISGRVLSRADTSHITRNVVEEALTQFRGEIMQRPPIFSALHINGKRLYEYAREAAAAGHDSIPVDVPKRLVRVDSLELVEWLEPGAHPYQIPADADQADSSERRIAEKMMEVADESEKIPNSNANDSKEKNSTDPSINSTTNTDSTTLPTPLEDSKILPANNDPTPTNGSVIDDSNVASASPAETSSIAGHKRSRSEDQDPFFREKRRREADAADRFVRETETARRIKVRDSEPLYMMTGALIPPSPSPSPSTDGINTISAPVPAAKIRMTVSSGFYVRSLCHDLGKAVGSLGLMANLVRTRQGEFELGKNVLEWENIEKGEEVWGPLVRDMLKDWMWKQDHDNESDDETLGKGETEDKGESSGGEKVKEA